MKKFRTAIVQYDTRTPDIEYNSQLAERLIREVKANGADIVLFPECFLTAYAAPDICEQSDEAQLRVDEILSHPDFISWYESAISESDERYTTILFSSAASLTRLYTMSISTSTSCAATDKTRISASTAGQTRTGGSAAWNRQYAAKTVLRGDQMRVFSLRA